ncbi:MAG TPA: DUF5668 domain-containing protein [Bryobacteraceae bacterium]|nr:DUF5668 domain-containing protein [Bryobacteraceae bacterium]
MEPENIKKHGCSGHNWASMVAGALIALIGVILLLQQTNLFDARYLLRFWPLAVVLYGLLKLFQGYGWAGRVWGVLLIVAGTLLQLDQLNILHVGFWNLFWPLILIGVGLTMLFGTLEAKRGRWPPPVNSAGPVLNEFAVFGGGERRFGGAEFEGGQMNAIFGGFKVDLKQASMKGNQADLEFNAIFGGGEILVPESWNVVMRGLGIFGGYSDSSRHPKTDDPASVKTLVVRGVAMFGGVEVKN